MKFRYLLKPGKIGSLELKNRIIMPAMGTLLASEQGAVTDTMLEWYARRAGGGVGLIIVEACSAATAVDLLRINARPLRCDHSSLIPGLEDLARVIHENDAMAGIELTPGGGASARGEPWIVTAQRPEPVSPSGIPAFGYHNNPRVLSAEEIERIVSLCGDAAQNIKQSGFDMIEIHAHAGYLISEFLSPYYNKRTDKYGGSMENRCRFLLEIVGAIQNAVNHSLTITVKYSVNDYLPDSWDMKQSQALAKMLEAVGVNGIGVSAGSPETAMPYVPPYFYPRGCHVPLAHGIKQVTSIPVFVGGRLNDPRLADNVLRDGKADFIYEGRALIADPDWPKKVTEDRVREIRPCLSCNECRHSLINRRQISCAVNAVAGREDSLDMIEPAKVSKKVLVVGGGPAGMEAARIAAVRGHNVVLCERSRRMGGLMLLAGIHNQEIVTFTKWMVTQLKKLAIEIRLQTEVTPALVDEINPDAIILAIGGSFVKPQISGIDKAHVFSTKDLFNIVNGTRVKKGTLLYMLSPLMKYIPATPIVRKMLRLDFPIRKTVVVIGGQFPGCATALFLAHKGKNVTLIEESAEFGKDVETHTIVALAAEAKRGKIRILTSTKIEEITDREVIVSCKGNKTPLKADSIIVALDLAPTDSDLATKLNSKAKQLYVIGDAKSFLRIKNAISEGYISALSL